MTEYVIGPGVAQAISDSNDEARSDEQYVILEPGEKISQTFARDAVYWWYEADNQVNRIAYK
jgi:hypothetical protein